MMGSSMSFCACALILLQLQLGVHGRPGAGATAVEWYRTAQNTPDRLSPQTPFSFGADFLSSATVKIDRTGLRQTIIGFGGAFTESTSYVFSTLNATLQSQVLNMYFSENGLRYNMARLPIGSCDFSLSNYNYDNVSGDAGLTHFSINHDKELIIPFILQAMKTRKMWTNDSLNIVASPWSPPGWMKQDDDPYCPLDCLLCDLKDEYKAAWSLYFSKFLTAYAVEGINIWGITVQNEPGACPLLYEGMHFTPETERDYIKQYLGPQISKDHPNVSILIYDHNKDHVVEWAKTIYSDPDAAKYLWGTAVHWYSGDQFNNLNTTHYLFPNKPILATEATVAREKDPKAPLWSHGEHYAHDIIGDMNNWVVGFIDWNLLLDMLGGPDHAGPDKCEGLIKCGSDAMLLADADNQVVFPQVFYYYVGHISKFVPRGSRQISNEVINSTLECTAFLTPSPDQKVVVVVMNTGDQAVPFKLADMYQGMVQAANITALPHSIQTFIYP